jgi:hypothetical protein
MTPEMASDLYGAVCTDSIAIVYICIGRYCIAGKRQNYNVKVILVKNEAKFHS